MVVVNQQPLTSRYPQWRGLNGDQLVDRHLQCRMTTVFWLCACNEVIVPGNSKGMPIGLEEEVWLPKTNQV